LSGTALYFVAANEAFRYQWGCDESANAGWWSPLRSPATNLWVAKVMTS